MKLFVLPATLALLGLSAPAMADVCVTQSRNLFFQAIDEDQGLASTVAIQQCTDNAFTDHAECFDKLQCGSGVEPAYPSGLVACATRSGGRDFRSQGPDINVVTREVVDQCQRDAGSSECAANLSCADAAATPAPQPAPQPGPAPAPLYMRCSTHSNGYVFRTEGYGENETLNQLLKQCYSTRGTFAPQCMQNARCSAGPGG